ncbi:MAG: hypothetical protein FJX76_26745 [Armatimonadetes bacterium]|nr:hypothetical protein [Armatimonadota bacterium]
MLASSAWADHHGRGNAKGGRFAKAGTNADGAISREEWRSGEESFQRHDRDGDRRLSRDELFDKSR